MYFECLFIAMFPLLVFSIEMAFAMEDYNRMDHPLQMEMAKQISFPEQNHNPVKRDPNHHHRRHHHHHRHPGRPNMMMGRNANNVQFTRPAYRGQHSMARMQYDAELRRREYAQQVEKAAAAMMGHQAQCGGGQFTNEAHAKLFLAKILSINTLSATEREWLEKETNQAVLYKSASKQEFIEKLLPSIQQKVRAARGKRAWGRSANEHVQHFFEKAMALDLTTEEKKAMAEKKDELLKSRSKVEFIYKLPKSVREKFEEIRKNKYSKNKQGNPQMAGGWAEGGWREGGWRRSAGGGGGGWGRSGGGGGGGWGGRGGHGGHGGRPGLPGGQGFEGGGGGGGGGGGVGGQGGGGSGADGRNGGGGSGGGGQGGRGGHGGHGRRGGRGGAGG